MSWCFKDEVSRYSEKALDLLSENETIAPPIWSLEVTNVLLVAQRNRRLSEAQSARFLELLRSLPIKEEPSPSFLSEALPLLAREHGLSAYDASYLDLALRAGVPLATMDKKMKAAARRCDLLLKFP